MAARVCPVCNTAYPERVIKCHRCSQFTGYHPEREIDEDWDKPKPLRDKLAAVNRAAIIQWQGMWVVHDTALSSAGYEERYVGMVFRVVGASKDLFFETRLELNVSDGKVRQDGWMVRQIDPDHAFDNVTPEDIIGGAKA